MSGPVPYGPGAWDDPQEGAGRRPEVPLGPEISWPNGFRQLGQGTRDGLASAYRPEPVYQQPAFDDYGYGDPGYADPSYDGPRAPGGPAAYDPPGYRPPDAPVAGYQVPEFRAYARPGTPAPGHAGPGHAAPGGPDYPVTGAQEALPGTGPQPAARPWAGPEPGGRPAAAGSAYPEQWYDHPRLADQAGPDRRSDPRLQGMRYDELRYDEPESDGPRPGDALDDESWFAELRRNAPAVPDASSRPAPSAAPGRPWAAGPDRAAEPPRSGYGQPSRYPAAPERSGGFGSGRPGAGSPDRDSSGLQLSAADLARTGPRPGDAGPRPGDAGPRAVDTGSRPGDFGPRAGDFGSRSGDAGPRPGDFGERPGDAGPRSGGPQAVAGLGPWAEAPAAAFLGAPTAHVGVLTPPAGNRLADLQDSGPQLVGPRLAPPAAGRPAAPAVRPGHGLDGPEITSSWPAQPPADDSFAEFWAEDDDEAEYSGLFGDREPAAAETKTAARRSTGRRRGRSNDHRLWLGLGGVVVVAAAAITGIIKFEFPSHGGPAHVMATPARIGAYMRTVDLERQTNVAQLRNEVITMSAGQASRVVSAVYESGNSAAGNDEQIVMFIGGHLANAAPATSVTSFAQKFPGARVVSAGSLGGQAACVEEGGASNAVSMCAWFDNDSFGEIVSPTMNASALAKEMLVVRPAVETVVRK